MSEELQHLIDRIEKEGVDKAQAQADEIVAGAKKKAAELVKQAEADSKALLEKAERDAEAFTVRSQRTLEQSARDLLISVGQGVENILSDLVRDSLDEAMSIEVIEKMLVQISQSCAEHQGSSQIEFLISKADQKDLIKFFADQYRKKLIEGIQIHVDSELFKGFKVSMVDQNMYHDFSSEAIAEALCNLLRPHLSEIVNRVAREETQAAAQE